MFQKFFFTFIIISLLLNLINSSCAPTINEKDPNFCILKCNLKFKTSEQVIKQLIPSDALKHCKTLKNYKENECDCLSLNNFMIKNYSHVDYSEILKTLLNKCIK